MVAVRLESVSKHFGATQVVHDVNLEIAEGEFVTLLGASGSGKTTCLRMVAGFVSPSSGRILFGGEDITAVPPHRRDTGMVFQHYALFPHMTVAQNVAFGLKLRRLPSREVKASTAQALRLVQLEELAHRRPAQLSGGQKQRVALARAVVIRPKILLLDEPLGALDQKLREELQGEIKRVQQALGITTLFVTHDQTEALGMSDRIVVLRDGRVLQVDTPARLYSRPNSAYVAGFVGRTNLLPAVVTARDEEGRLTLRLVDGGARMVADAQQGRRFGPGASCLVAFRPEDARLEPGAENAIRLTVEKATYGGDGWMLAGRGPGGATILVRVPADAALPAIGAEIVIGWPRARCLLLPADGQAYEEEPVDAPRIETLAMGTMSTVS